MTLLGCLRIAERYLVDAQGKKARQVQAAMAQAGFWIGRAERMVELETRLPRPVRFASGNHEHQNE